MIQGPYNFKYKIKQFHQKDIPCNNPNVQDQELQQTLHSSSRVSNFLGLERVCVLVQCHYRLRCENRGFRIKKIIEYGLQYLLQR
jgi:hypothetical protein